MIKNPEDRTEYISSIIESAGGKLISSYIEVGGNNIFAILDMPDEESVAALHFAVFSQGVSTFMKITPVIVPGDSVAAFKKAASISYQPPSA